MTSRTPPFGPLITTEAAAALLADSRVRFADTRWYLAKPGGGRVAYEAGHLPGAIFVDLDADLSGPKRADGVGGRHPLPDPSTVAARLGAAGFDDSSIVIAYDDTGGSVAARLWWMLDDLGFHNVAVLDGGITAWVAAGLPVTTDITTHPAGTMHLAPNWTKRIERDALRSKLGSVRLLDARPGPRYRGEIEPVDAYPGHIATAISAPTDGNLGEGSRFHGADKLRDRYAALGADTGDVVVSCGSGVSATHNALAMRVAGLPDPVLYDGSWSDWSRSGLPGISGAEPGSTNEARTPD